MSRDKHIDALTKDNKPDSGSVGSASPARKTLLSKKKASNDLRTFLLDITIEAHRSKLWHFCIWWLNIVYDYDLYRRGLPFACEASLTSISNSFFFF